MDIIEENLQIQINKLKSEIRACDNKDFDKLIDKYNVFNNIKQTFDEELVEVENFQNILEEDQDILEKIYEKLQGLEMYSLPSTFDEVMLETFLEEINNENEKEKELEE